MATANKISLVTNRAERAKSYLLSQFKDRPNINKIVEALVEELQEIENGIIDIQNARKLDTSFGVWLDELGLQAKVNRNGRDNTDYKTSIKIAQAKRNMSATDEEIEYVVGLLTGDPYTTVDNPYPYMMELVSYFFCVGDDLESLAGIADMFPTLTRVRLIRRGESRFKLGTAGQGFGSGATLDDLVYVRQGAVDDERFVISDNQVIPPPVTTGVYIIAPPTLSGDNTVTSVLSCATGLWGGDEPITYTYQWYIDGAAVSGATASTFTIPAGSEGKVINCLVTATNAFSSATSLSNTITVSNAPAPAAYFAVDGGLEDYYTVIDTPYGTSITNASQLVFNTDGTISYEQNGNPDFSRPFLVHTGTNHANDTVITYQVLTGSSLSGLAPNVPRTLNTPLTLSQSVTANRDSVKEGTYRITLSRLSDPSISVTKDVYIVAEILTNM